MEPTSAVCVCVCLVIHVVSGLLCVCVCVCVFGDTCSLRLTVCVCVCRERGRKLEARNAAIQTSVEELERKIQQKVCSFIL